eukprot:TRINITY_DN10434_c0_g1_i2.p1 TRINITY_DN10434_c0_g1~~TRINITY_DN10434_c0_g1_i2.p1  ORF type:complete len:458 (+),score=65.66 TRINITY_DN10434_c0_g1_i2:56-1429(+)
MRRKVPDPASSFRSQFPLSSVLKEENKKTDTLQKKGTLRKRWYRRFFVLYHEYLLYYKRFKSESPKIENLLPSGVLSLMYIDVKNIRDVDKNGKKILVIPFKYGRRLMIKSIAESTFSLKEWSAAIRNRCKEVAESTLYFLHNETIMGKPEEFVARMQKCIPRNYLKIEDLSEDYFNQWVLDLKVAHDSVLNFSDYLKKIKLLARIYKASTFTKSWIDWFTGLKGEDSCTNDIQKLEEKLFPLIIKQIKQFKPIDTSQVDETLAKCSLEELNDLHHLCSSNLELIELYNSYQSSLHNKLPEFRKQRKKITIFHNKIISEAKARDIELAKPKELLDPLREKEQYTSPKSPTRSVIDEEKLFMVSQGHLCSSSDSDSFEIDTASETSFSDDNISIKKRGWVNANPSTDLIDLIKANSSGQIIDTMTIQYLCSLSQEKTLAPKTEEKRKNKALDKPTDVL